jgi:hypothetical protein
MIQLVVTQAGRSPHTIVIGGVTNVGRGPGNDLMLVDPMVSWNHAVLWVEGGRLWVRDLGTTNGTWVGGVRISAPTAVTVGERLRFGLAVEAEVQRRLSDEEQNPWMVEDLTGGVRLPLRDGFVIGASPSADLVFPGEKPIAATFRLQGDVPWIEGEAGRFRVVAGEVMVVQYRPIVVRQRSQWQATRTDSDVRSQVALYRLTLDVGNPTGPRATVTDLVSRVEAMLEGNRAVMLYVLGRRRADDLAAGLHDAEIGWCTNEEVQTAIWGQLGDSNKLHVLLYRLRGELRGLGFDPAFIEKQQGYVRLQVAEVVVR